MGIDQHNTLMVYGDREKVEKMYLEVPELLEEYATDIIHTRRNNISIFYIAPCGSKLGWTTYEAHLDLLKKYQDRLRGRGVLVSRISVGDLNDSIIS